VSPLSLEVFSSWVPAGRFICWAPFAHTYAGGHLSSILSSAKCSVPSTSTCTRSEGLHFSAPPGSFGGGFRHVILSPLYSACLPHSFRSDPARTPEQGRHGSARAVRQKRLLRRRLRLVRSAHSCHLGRLSPLCPLIRFACHDRLLARRLPSSLHSVPQADLYYLFPAWCFAVGHCAWPAIFRLVLAIIL